MGSGVSKFAINVHSSRQRQTGPEARPGLVAARSASPRWLEIRRRPSHHSPLSTERPCPRPGGPGAWPGLAAATVPVPRLALPGEPGPEEIKLGYSERTLETDNSQTSRTGNVRDFRRDFSGETFQRHLLPFRSEFLHQGPQATSSALRLRRPPILKTAAVHTP